VAAGLPAARRRALPAGVAQEGARFLCEREEQVRDGRLQEIVDDRVVVDAEVRPGLLLLVEPQGDVGEEGGFGGAVARVAGEARYL
jgi:hypothetical protein